MTPVTDKLIEEMAEMIVKAVNPRQVILFGSHARGAARPGSDVDFLVIEDEPFGAHRSRRQEMAKLWRLLACFAVPKDFLVYSREEVDQWRHSRNHVIAHALKEGKLLYERH